MKQKINEVFAKNITLKRMLTVMMGLVILYLIALTEPFWRYIMNRSIAIMMPFLIGFGIAYILHPMVKFLERKFKIKKQWSVPIILVLFVALIILLFSSFVPNLISDFTKVINSSAEGIQRLYQFYIEVFNGNPEPWVQDVANEATKLLKGLISEIPTIPVFATQFIDRIVSVLTTSLFSLVIGLYIIFDYEKVTGQILKGADKISPKLSKSLIVINQAVLQYLRSLIVIMAVTFVEYTLLYSLVGHNYASVLGVMAAIGLLIPYIGPISVQVLAVLTGLLILPMPRVIMLTVGLLILSNVDNYVIQPMIYRKRDKIDPLASLFAFFAASTMFGFVGVLLSMPLYFGTRAVYRLYKRDWELEVPNVELITEESETRN